MCYELILVLLYTYVCIYICILYIYIYTHLYILLYIYIYIERERDVLGALGPHGVLRVPGRLEHVLEDDLAQNIILRYMM